MLNELQEKFCSESTWDFSDLKALFLNCTLKQSPEVLNTDALIGLLIDRLKHHEPDIETEVVRVQSESEVV